MQEDSSNKDNLYYEKSVGAKMFKNPEKITREFYDKYCHPLIDEEGNVNVNVHGGVETYNLVDGKLVLIDLSSEYCRGSAEGRGGFKCGKPPIFKDINNFCLDCLNDQIERFAPGMVFMNNRIRFVDWGRP